MSWLVPVALLSAVFGQVSSEANPASLPVVEGLPAPKNDKALEPPKPKPVSVVFDVHQPGKLREAFAKNDWLHQVASEPLGVGFAGPWAAFLRTRGEDVKAPFSGPVFDVLASKALSRPFRVVWFAGGQTPAVVVPDAGEFGVAAFDSLQFASRGIAHSSCPFGLKKIEVHRLLLAEHAVYATRQGSQLIFARLPGMVVQAACAGLPKMAPKEGVDAELALFPEPFGREAQFLHQVLGLSGPPHLQLAFDGGRLVPVGLDAKLMRPGNLGAAALPDSMLRMIPERTPVVLAARLRLPELLEPAVLSKAIDLSQRADREVPREVVLLWTPRGDAAKPSELALLWSRPEDSEALDRLFDGPNDLAFAKVCGHLAFASSKDLLGQIQRSCRGEAPSKLHASPAVVAGLRAKASVLLEFDLGPLLSRLVEDGWATSLEKADAAKKPKPPPEIEDAKRRLEELPDLGFSGTKNDNVLVPGGFRS
ncbi:MAG: hypothetical protein QM765_28720 [Myxococcales bacterium]